MSNYCCIKNLKFCFLQIFEIVHWKHLVVSDDVVGENDLLFPLVSAFIVFSLVCFFAKENIPGFPEQVVEGRWSELKMMVKI